MNTEQIKPKAYLRVSTLEQAEVNRVGLDMQKEGILNSAKLHGYLPLTDSDFYIDKLSGSDTERPELQRLRADIAKGQVKALLVWRLDRISRSALDTLTLFKEFEQNKVVFISATQPFDTSSDMGKLVMQITAIFAEMELNTIRERNLTARYIKVARDGTNFGGYPPFGYRSENKHFVIVEEEAEKVRLIFELYNRFKSNKRVVKELINQKIALPFLIRDTQIRRILKNVKYTGRMMVKGKTYEKKHPEIISEDVFTKAQEILKQNFQNHAQVGLIAPGFFIRDVAQCGECGHQLVQKQTKSQKKIGGNLYYYACSLRRTNPGKCRHRKNYRKDFLENKVLEEIFKHVEGLSSDESYLFKHLKINSQIEITRLRGEIKNKEDSLQGKKRAKERILNALEKSDDEDVLSRLERIKQEIDSIGCSILEARIKLEREQTKKDDFKSQSRFYKEFKSTWAEANDQEKRDLINDLIKVIRVFIGGKIEIEYNF
ncbi:MAG: recombinase family protein [Candidatus Omnitrophica bacterium]|nr:recombinase family protein [Candidatus Omnitrophota bacterium]